jgi:hypothetical protein
LDQIASDAEGMETFDCIEEIARGWEHEYGILQAKTPLEISDVILVDVRDDPRFSFPYRSIC